MALNLRRGFNRLYIVLACMWAVYCLLVYPVQQREKALKEWAADKQVCYASQHTLPDAMSECLKLAERTFQTKSEPWSIVNFYPGARWLLLFAVVVLPLVGYGVCRGCAAVSVWIWHGFFRVRSPS
jgi:hypothetical protein